jgi:hypothetical protein
MINISMTLKNQKTKINLKPKINSTQAQIHFFTNFNDKKTYNINSSHKKNN